MILNLRHLIGLIKMTHWIEVDGEKGRAELFYEIGNKKIFVTMMPIDPLDRNIKEIARKLMEQRKKEALRRKRRRVLFNHQLNQLN